MGRRVRATRGTLIGIAAAMVMLTIGGSLAFPWAARSAVAANDPVTIFGPAGSGCFGSSITKLPSGNFVVTDPCFSAGGVANVGAVYLFSGTSYSIIGTMTGSNTNDRVGDGGITVLANGNFVATSGHWNNDSRAITWMSGVAGGVSVVSASNSLIGQPGNGIGFRIVALTQGNYVVVSPFWDDGALIDVGAVTWGSGTTGVSGTISAANSLVGSQPDDWVGLGDTAVLANGNYVVASPNWDNGFVIEAGAITWGNGSTGTVGQVSTSNSIVGTQADGRSAVVALTNGNYVVQTPGWDNGAMLDAGAVTWVSGVTPTSSVVSSSNSMIGSHAGDRVGYNIDPLPNGNYIVSSISWDDGTTVDVGAVTWLSGNASTSGVVSAANSLIGGTAGDFVGLSDNSSFDHGSVVALTNGNVVVSSWFWDNGATADAGAYTWMRGDGPTAGVVGPANSLVGGHAGDSARLSASPEPPVVALANGNYVVDLPAWDNGGTTDAGAVTWGNGLVGARGTVTAANSFVGLTTETMAGYSVTALVNGNYVIGSPGWDGAAIDSGAVTLAQGATGLIGTPSLVNSITGPGASDGLGVMAAVALTNGNYVIPGYATDVGGVVSIGSVTWANGVSGITGVVTASNSLVGLHAGDAIGFLVLALPNGNYYVGSPYWDNGSIMDAGAITWVNGSGPAVGTVSAANSVVGTYQFEYLGNGQGGIADLGGGWLVFSHPYWSTSSFGTALRIVGDGNQLVGVTSPSNSTTAIIGDVIQTNGVVLGVGANRLITFGLPAAMSAFTPLAPARLLETRLGQLPTVDGLFDGSGPLAGGSVLELSIAGRGGVPGDAIAVVLNVTITNPTASGFLTVYPCGSGPPTASNLNFVAGQTVANAVVTKIDEQGTICLFANVTTDVIVDVTGAYATLSGYTPVAPMRLLETRGGMAPTFDRQYSGIGAIVAGSTLVLPIAGRAGIPADATAAVLNITVTEPQAAGFVTVYPCGTDLPNASTLNYVANQTVPNAAIVKLDPGGRICIFSLATTHLVVDINGYHTTESRNHGIVPARLLETRSGVPPTVDSEYSGVGVVAAGTTLVLPIAGRAGIPVDATAAVLNITVTEPQAAGFVTVYPCGTDRPNASTLNFVANQTVPNAAIAKLDTSGRICIFTLTTTHLIVDANGYVL